MEEITKVLGDNLPAVIAAVLVVAKLLNKLTESWASGSTFRRVLKAAINLLDQFRLESVKDTRKILRKPATPPPVPDGTD